MKHIIGSRWKTIATVWAMLTVSGLAHASTIYLTGTINQSNADTSAVSVQNLSLNNIADGDAFTALLTFDGDLSAPGTFSLTGLSFTDTTVGASENAFLFGSFTITAQGATYQFDVLGCLASCAVGNQLALEFSIPVAELNSSGAASAVQGLIPMDLLEDGGSTDIQGSVKLYSFQGPVTSTVPEPASFILAGSFLIAIGVVRRKRANNN